MIIISGCATTGVEQPSQLEKPNVITGIDLQDYAVTVTADRPFTYIIYRSSDPYRMFVEFPDVNIGAFNSKIASNKAGITEIIPSQVESPAFMAKLEMLLQTPSEVESEYKNNVLIIKIKKEELTEKKELPAEESPKVALKEEPIKEKVLETKNLEPAVPEQKPLLPASNGPKATEISSISFEKSDGILKVVIKGNGLLTPNVFPLDNRIVIDVPDVVMGAQIPSTVISPLKGIRSGKHRDKIRLVLDLKEKTNFDVAAIGDSIVIALLSPEKELPALAPAPAMPSIAQKPEEKKEIAEVKKNETYPEGKCKAYLDGKENVNFEFQDQEIVPILTLFGKMSGCNILVHPEVKGKIPALSFRNVPWNLALETLLRTFSFGKSIEGNIIRIAPNTVFIKESVDAKNVEKAKKEAEEELSPLDRRTYHLTYANAEDIKRKLLGWKPTIYEDKMTKEMKLTYEYDEKLRTLSARGSATADFKSNVLVVSDTPIKLTQVEDFIREIDQPTRQVMIEARIVEINTNSESELGIQWGLNYKAPNTLSALGGSSGLGRGTFTGDNFLVDLPAVIAPGGGSGIGFGIINAARTFGLDLQISAMQTMGYAKIISNPRIMTLDRQEAKIKQGKSIPIRKLTTEGTVSTEFKDIDIELKVTPTITQNKTIDMDIDIKKEELDLTIPSIEGVPGTDKKEAKTKVRISDGETVVIGGMYKINTSDSESGVPGLMKIPILGWLFKKEKKTETTTELLMFITPRIVILEKP